VVTRHFVGDNNVVGRNVQGGLVTAKSGRLELGDNIYRQVYIQPL